VRTAPTLTHQASELDNFLCAAAQSKIDKYAPLIQELAAQGHHIDSFPDVHPGACQVLPIVVGIRGTIPRSTIACLRHLGVGRRLAKETAYKLQIATVRHLASILRLRRKLERSPQFSSRSALVALTRAKRRALRAGTSSRDAG